ncbi:CRISPR-associated protein Csx15 [Pseudomonas sp. NIBRBAC000502773]|uniref:CRISPR-associated protein Csx15 n=1 Tax=Pseudomonas sp. NIBRBAC000502773 TaxID=2590776 RepID=UPI001131406B|nr:CRISPR-associated protein Csx15 [Pseudomonas sp. NIBRBAC000502773]QDG56059.1 hypothetical protein NIBR502773_05825 [Pseudomonas sp. NIBRBAC000502773]
MTGQIINFSGHRLSTEAEAVLALHFEKVIDGQWPEFDFNLPITAQIQSALSVLPATLDGTKAVTIIPPGQSTLAVLLVSFLHGLLGHFPRICYLELSSSGLYLPRFETGISAQETRLAGRRFRLQRAKSLGLPNVPPEQ